MNRGRVVLVIILALFAGFGVVASLMSFFKKSDSDVANVYLGEMGEYRVQIDEAIVEGDARILLSLEPRRKVFERVPFCVHAFDLTGSGREFEDIRVFFYEGSQVFNSLSRNREDKWIEEPRADTLPLSEIQIAQIVNLLAEARKLVHNKEHLVTTLPLSLQGEKK